MQDDDRFVLGVDLDGVVADFYESLRSIAAEWLGVQSNTLPTEVTYGLPEWKLAAAGTYEDLHRFAVTQRALFREIRIMPNAAPVLRRLSKQDIRIRIITHRLYIKHFHQQCVDQTVVWLEHHGIPYWDLCFMKDKSAVGADLYVEDAPANVERLRKGGHKTIVFTNSTNRSLPGPRANDWLELEALVLEYHREWQAGTNAKP